MLLMLKAWYDKSIDRLTRYRITLHSFCVFAGILCIITTLSTVSTIINLKAAEQENRKELMKAGSFYVERIIRSTYMNYKEHSEQLKSAILIRIMEDYPEYKTNEALSKDVQEYYAKNDQNNKLFRIFSEESHKYLDIWFKYQPNVGVYIVSRHGVIYSTKKTQEERTINNAPDLLWKVTRGCLLLDPRTRLVKEVSFSDIKIPEPPPKTLNYSIMGDRVAEKDYIFLAPAFIYEEGDMFGVPDFTPRGEPIDNTKLAVILTYSMADIEDIAAIEYYGSKFEDMNVMNLAEATSDGFIRTGLTFVLTCGLFMLCRIVDARKEREKA